MFVSFLCLHAPGRLTFLSSCRTFIFPSAVTAGSVGFLEQPSVVFVRLQEAVLLDSVLEVSIPVRFFFLLLGPPAANLHYHQMGRSISTLMADKVLFCSHTVSLMFLAASTRWHHIVWFCASFSTSMKQRTKQRSSRTWWPPSTASWTAVWSSRHLRPPERSFFSPSADSKEERFRKERESRAASSMRNRAAFSRTKVDLCVISS